MTTEKLADESVEESLAEAKRLIDWLQYVREDEYSQSERKRLITATRRFAKTAQPIASKYIYRLINKNRKKTQ